MCRPEILHESSLTINPSQLDFQFYSRGRQRPNISSKSDLAAAADHQRGRTCWKIPVHPTSTILHLQGSQQVCRSHRNHLVGQRWSLSLLVWWVDRRTKIGSIWFCWIKWQRFGANGCQCSMRALKYEEVISENRQCKYCRQGFGMRLRRGWEIG